MLLVGGTMRYFFFFFLFFSFLEVVGWSGTKRKHEICCWQIETLLLVIRTLRVSLFPILPP
jgi:hypothetical protein